MGVVEQGMALSGATFGLGLGGVWFEQGVGVGQGWLSRTWLSRRSEQGLFEQGGLRAGLGRAGGGAWFEQVIGVVEQGMALSGARFGQGLGGG